MFFSLCHSFDLVKDRITSNGTTQGPEKDYGFVPNNRSTKDRSKDRFTSPGLPSGDLRCPRLNSHRLITTGFCAREVIRKRRSFGFVGLYQDSPGYRCTGTGPSLDTERGTGNGVVAEGGRGRATRGVYTDPSTPRPYGASSSWTTSYSWSESDPSSFCNEPDFCHSPSGTSPFLPSSLSEESRGGTGQRHRVRRYTILGPSPYATTDMIEREHSQLEGHPRPGALPTDVGVHSILRCSVTQTVVPGREYIEETAGLTERTILGSRVRVDVRRSSPVSLSRCREDKPQGVSSTGYFDGPSDLTKKVDPWRGFPETTSSLPVTYDRPTVTHR